MIGRKRCHFWLVILCYPVIERMRLMFLGKAPYYCITCLE